MRKLLVAVGLVSALVRGRSMPPSWSSPLRAIPTSSVWIAFGLIEGYNPTRRYSSNASKTSPRSLSPGLFHCVAQLAPL